MPRQVLMEKLDSLIWVYTVFHTTEDFKKQLSIMKSKNLGQKGLNKVFDILGHLPYMYFENNWYGDKFQFWCICISPRVTSIHNICCSREIRKMLICSYDMKVTTKE